MPPRRARASFPAIALACLLPWPTAALAAPPSQPTTGADAPTEGPKRPPEQGWAEPGEAEPSEAPTKPSDPPPPSIDPDPVSGIEFAVPPPDANEPDEPEPGREPPLSVSFPDPGMAPNDGAGMLVLSGTTVALTGMGLAAGLVVGLRNQTPLSWLLPSTIIPTVGVLAFAGGGLYLGITRRQAYRRWEIGYRVIGTPQGAGLRIGGSFALLAALGFIPAGGFALSNGNDVAGATMIAIGSAAAVAMPVMFAIGAKRQREYARTGGWRRKPIPPLPGEARLQLRPTLSPLWGGGSVGVAGRF